MLSVADDWGSVFSLRFSFVYDSPKSTDGVFIERAVHLRVADVPMEVDREIDFYVRFVLAFDDIHKTVDGGDEFLARSTFRVGDEQCPNARSSTSRPLSAVVNTW